MLPELRQDLSIFKGPITDNGAPSWSLQDPMRNQFYQIDWLNFEILSRWHYGHAQDIVSAINSETSIDSSCDDVEDLLEFLGSNNLLKSFDADKLSEDQLEGNSKQLIRKFMQNYMFARFPLFNPDKFLLKNHKWLSRYLFTRSFLYLTLFSFLTGLVLLGRQWHTFQSSFIDTLTPGGIVSVVMTFVAVKVFHELGHAFSAKHYGCRVPTMGVALIFFFPIAYTDVNESWKLKNKHHRLIIAGSGILSELVLAAWATLFWSLSPDGLIKDACFLVATVTWTSTLLVNLSPFMRFDGYFILSDYLGVSNLHQRSFALFRWRLREILFALGAEPPDYFSARKSFGLILFAVSTLIYRFILFLTIAYAFVRFLPTVPGLILAAMELYWFVFRPVLNELKYWFNNELMYRNNNRRSFTLMLLVLIGCLLFLPWNSRITSQGVLKPEHFRTIESPSEAQLKVVHIKNGQKVRKGDLMFSFEDLNLDSQRKKLQEKHQLHSWQNDVASFDSQFIKQKNSLQAEQQHSRSELNAIQQGLAKLNINAEFDGEIHLLQHDIDDGSWLAKNQVFALLADTDTWQVISYLNESDIRRISEGSHAYFYSDTQGVKIDLTVVDIDFEATTEISEPLLGSVAQGEILLREINGKLASEENYYKVILKPESPVDPDNIIRGRVAFTAERKSIAYAFVDRLTKLTVMEVFH